MCKTWLLCLAAQKKVRLLCVSWLRQTENRQLFSHHRQAGQEKSVTYSSTVNSIKVTTRAHRDAPQPMNVSLVKISSSSGLHWDRKERHVVGERQKRGECCQRVLEVDKQLSHIWKIPHLIWKKVISYVIAIHKWLHFYKLKILPMVLLFDELTNFYVLQVNRENSCTTFYIRQHNRRSMSDTCWQKSCTANPIPKIEY